MMKRRPDKERLRTALLCGQPDCVPLLEISVAQEVKEAFLGKPVRMPEDEIAFWAQAGYDAVLVPFAVNFNPANRPPKGALRTVTTSSRNLYCDKEQTFGFEAEDIGIIATMKDFEAHEWPDPDALDLTPLREYARLIPDGMGIISGHPGIFHPAMGLMGFEVFSEALAEQPELVACVFGKLGDISARVAERILDTGLVDVYGTGDDLAYTQGFLYSPDVMRRFQFPWYKRIGQAARAKDVPMLFHTDGSVWDVIDDLIDCGVNALHPIEPKAMDIVEVKRQYGDHLCVVGNIDLGGVLALGTPEEVREAVRNKIRAVAPGGGYCLGSSNSVPNYVPIKNFRAMNEACIEFGAYPITV